MARVVVYQRSIDAVQTDMMCVTQKYSEHGMKIKEEPPDEDTESLSDGNTMNTNETTTAEDKLHNLRNDKENQCTLTVNHADPQTNLSCSKEKTRSRKRLISQQTREQDDYPAKKRRRHFSEITENCDNPILPVITRTSFPDVQLNRRRSRHSEKHQPKKPKSPVKSRRSLHLPECDVCYIKFDSKKKLAYHVRKYSQPQNYMCDKCSKRFWVPGKLVQHNRSCLSMPHLLPYTCDICKEQFRQKRTLQGHIYHYHGPHSPSVVSSDKTSQPVPSNEKTPSTNISSRERDQPKKATANPKSSPTRKLRQTTLMEFLPVSPKKSDSVTSEKPQQKITKRRVTPFSSPLTPFVQIHQSIDTVAALLSNGLKKVKDERCDEGMTLTTSRTNRYSFRRSMNRSTPTPDCLNDPNKFTKDANKLRVSLTPIRRRRSTLSLSSIRNLKQMFQCKKCTIPLTRCDELLVTSLESKLDEVLASKNEEEKSISLEIKETEVVLVKDDAESSTSDKASVKNEKTIRCRICPKNFSSKEMMRGHIKLEHMAYMSSICSARFASRMMLLNHYLRHHVTYKRTSCCVCHERLSSRIALKRHMMLHCIKILQLQKDKYLNNTAGACYLSKKYNKCGECGKKFWLKSCLQQHQIFCCQKKARGSKQDESDDKTLTVRNQEVTTHVVRSPRKSPVKSSRQEQASEPKIGFPSTSANVVHSPRKSPAKSSRQEQTSQPKIGSPSTSANVVHSPRKSPAKSSCQEQASEPKIGSPSTSANVVHSPSKSPAKSSSQEQASEPKIGSPSTSANTAQKQLPSTPKSKNSQAARIRRRMKFPCSICGKQYQTLPNLNKHQRTYLGPRKYQCKVCSTAFSTMKLLRSHVIATHAPDAVNKYQHHCRFCKQGFFRASNLRIHEHHWHANQMNVCNTSSHSNPIEIINTVCAICNLAFESYDSFIEHNMYYYKGQVFTCFFCSKNFHGMYMLNHHNKVVHYPNVARRSYAYTCQVCNEGFNQEAHFQAHTLHVHMKDIAVRPTMNDIDYRNSPSDAKITAVQETNQLGMNAFTCSICDLNFTNKTDLVHHQVEYSPYGKFQCDKCTKVCSTKSMLNIHRSLNHTEYDVSYSYKCRFCGEVLTTSISMMCHEKHYHPNGVAETNSVLYESVNKLAIRNQEPTNNKLGTGKDALVCLTCGATFDNEKGLKEHLFEYSDIGEHACSICHRKFAELHRLEIHMIKHSKLNFALSDYHCPICHEGCLTRTHVRMHVLHLHGHERFTRIFVNHIKNVIFSKTADNDVVDNRARLSEVTSDPVLNTSQTNATQAVIVVSDASGDPGKEPPSAVSTSSEAPSKTSNSPTPRSGKQKTAQCSECKMQFSNSRNLAKHIERHKDTGNYVCEVCGRKYEWETLFQEHQRKHVYEDTNGALLKYKCPHCAERFRTSVAVNSHIVHMHDKSGPKVGSQLETPAATQTVSPKLVTGQDKNDTAKMETSDKANNAKDSPKLKAILCLTDTATNDNENMTTSELKNGGQVSFICPICTISCPSYSQFQMHVRSTHPKQMIQRKAVHWPDNLKIIDCMLCDGSFLNEQYFKHHVESVHSPVTGKPQEKTDDSKTSESRRTSVATHTTTDDEVEVIWENLKDVSMSATKQKTSKTPQKLINGTVEHGVQKVRSPGSKVTVIADNSHVGKVRVRSFANINNG